MYCKHNSINARQSSLLNLLRKTPGVLVIIILLSPFPVNADTLVIPDIANQPGGAPDSTPRPARGMTMEEVRSQFGPARQAMGPVGDPPITRWVYDNFVVTFEHEYVIHSVAKRRQ